MVIVLVMFVMFVVDCLVELWLVLFGEKLILLGVIGLNELIIVYLCLDLLVCLSVKVLFVVLNELLGGLLIGQFIGVIIVKGVISGV